MVTILNLKFKDSLGKTHNIKLSHPKKDLKQDTVRKAMEMISQTHLLIKNDTELAQQAIGAAYVSTTNEPIFSDEA